MRRGHRRPGWRSRRRRVDSLACCLGLCVRWFPIPAGRDPARRALVPAIQPVLPRPRRTPRRTGVEVDHVTLFRWVQRFTPLLVEAARSCRHLVGDRWFVDETYVRVAGVWRYVYRAVDQYGQVIDVLVRRAQDAHAAAGQQPEIWLLKPCAQTTSRKRASGRNLIPCRV